MSTSITTTTRGVGVPFNASILTGQLAASSIAMYQRDFLAYLDFAGTSEQAFNAVTLARYRTHLAEHTALSPNTINRMLAAVKRLMKEAAIQGYMSHESAEAFEQVRGVKLSAMIERTKDTARTRIIPDAMRRLAETPDTTTLIGKRDAALLHTLASSGLRASELASLLCVHISQVGSNYVLAVRGKNQAQYEDAPLSREAGEAIEVWLEARPVQSAYVFTSFTGRGESRAIDKPMSEVAIWQTVQKYTRQIGLEHVKPHDLRRFVGTQLAKTDIRKAQKALRHKRIDTTARHYVLDDLEPGLTNNLY